MRFRHALIAFVLSCGGSRARNDLRVMSYTPQGPIEMAQPLEIRFDRAVVPAEQVGKPAATDAIAIIPAVAWKGYWQDRQTLVVEPTQPLAPSTRYQVSLGGELGHRTAEFTFAFVHRPLVVEGVWGVDADALPTDGDLPLSFNQPVRASDAAARCRLEPEGGAAAIALAAKGGSTEPALNVALRPAKPLVAGARYTLACAGLVGAGGNTALDKPYALAVRARPTLAVAKFEPAGRDIPADEVTLAITFTTPVTLDAARKAVTSTPAIHGIDQGYLSGDGTVYKVTADLETETDYAIKIAPLADTFGQKLAKPVVETFKTGDARPRLSMERGIFALEASAKGYPLWSRNVSKFAVECAAIPHDRVVQLLTTDMNYDPWGGNSDGQPIDWQKLGVKPKTKLHATTGKNKWQLHELDLGATCGGGSGQRGVYLAEVSSDDIKEDPDRGWLTPRKNRVLANVTEMGVLLKIGTASGIVWVTSLATGAPIAGAKVTVYTPAGKQVFAETTNGDGLVRVPGSAQLFDRKPQGAAADPDAAYADWDNYRAQRLIATIEKGGDLAIVDGNWSNGIQSWNFGVPEDRGGGAVRIRGFIQSDRGLYRPGEEVHFKGIARAIASGRAPSIPGKRDVTVEVTDSRGQIVNDTNAKLTKFGGFAFDMTLAPDASLGDYYVAATVGGQVFRERFTVEEFRPAAFEISLAPPAGSSPRPGDKLAIDLDAKYFTGSAVANAKVEWSVRARKHRVKLHGYDEYTFSADPRDGWWWYGERDDYGELITNGDAKTDGRGHLRIAARDGAARATPMDYIASVSVTDGSDQTLAKSAVITAHQTSLYLGMHANEMVQAVGMPFGVNLVAVKPDGTRAATKAHLAFVKTINSCAWEQIGARSFQRCDSSAKTMIERDVEIAAGGSHTERIYPTEPGDYIVRVTAKDDGGRDVAVASEIWVIGKGEAFWSGDEGDRMTLVASKASYAPGETARLVAQANLVAPTALVTVERDGILEARVQKMKSANEGVELAIADAWAPNVFASVALVSGRHGAGDAKRPMFKMGLVELKVSSAQKQLDVAVALDRERVRPGEKVTGKIRVTSGGAPVAAEVSLSAADEGVLSLIAYQTPNPMKTFYATYGLGVDSATSWNRIARLADPQSGDPDEGADAHSRLDGQRVRSKFVASAYWKPLLVTDAHGEVSFSFVAPDNLTAFRLMAVAADMGDRFGAGDKRLVVSKPLEVQPALPRFLRGGDVATVGVVIHNHTDAAGVAIVTARSNGAVLATTSDKVNVPANGSARARFAATASQNAAASFDFAIAMGGEKDAVRVTIPIDRPRVYETKTLVDRALQPGETWQAPLALAPDAVRADSTLAITIDRTGVGQLAPGLRALVEYPYGCLEQTLSRFVPLVAATDLAKTLDDAALRGTKAEQFVASGVAKVIRHQQGDGLFSLWPQSGTYPHLSAYALWGLAVARDAGVSVPDDVFARGTVALARWANGNVRPGSDGAVAAMAAYVMALTGKADAALVARLYALRGGLPAWGQAFLLRAMKLGHADGSELATLEKDSVAGVAVKDGRAIVRDSASSGEREHYMSSDVRATAMTLAALLEVDPASALVDPLAQGLLAARDAAGRWETTQDDVWSLVALAQYAKRAAGGDTTETVTVGDKEVSKRKILGGEVVSLRLPMGTLAGERVAITVDRGARVSARVIEARVDAGAAESHGYRVTREYRGADGKAKTSFAAGELVTVALTVHADARHRWVALVDPLPAGFEVVNPALGGTPPPAQSQYRWSRPPTWSHQDLRDDRVAWFADDLDGGDYAMTYQVRATTAGTFAAMPTTIEAMYQPDVRGRGERASIAVAK